MRLVSCGFSLDVVDGRLMQTTAHLAAFSGNSLVLDWVLQTGGTADKQVSIYCNTAKANNPMKLFRK